MNSTKSTKKMTKQESNLADLDIHPIVPISKNHNPVFLIHTDQDFVIKKFFPYHHDHPSAHYLNSKNAMSLDHPNLISIKASEDKVSGEVIERKELFSALTMEVAPYGDFHTLITENRLLKEDKFIRTYFHQLIEGIEYMHSQGVSHLDLKLGNVLLGKDYILKIADFDACYWLIHTHSHGIKRQGTVNFRAPEVKEGKILTSMASDIYSAAIILFAMKTGMLPYHEEKTKQMYEAMLNDPKAYWEAQVESSEVVAEICDDFKDLFISMVNPNPIRRITIPDIKKSRWYQGPIYEKSELKTLIKSKLKIPKLNSKV